MRQQKEKLLWFQICRFTLMQWMMLIGCLCNIGCSKSQDILVLNDRTQSTAIYTSLIFHLDDQYNREQLSTRLILNEIFPCVDIDSACVNKLTILTLDERNEIKNFIGNKDLKKQKSEFVDSLHFRITNMSEMYFELRPDSIDYLIYRFTLPIKINKQFYIVGYSLSDKYNHGEGYVTLIERKRKKYVIRSTDFCYYGS